MSINDIGSINSRSNLYNYLNEAIIKPTQFLIKQEAHFLSVDNKELRRNNEDLANRIEQMFLEFGLIPGSSSHLTDNYTTTEKGSQSRIKSKTIDKNYNIGSKSMTDNASDGGTNNGTSRSQVQATLDYKTKKSGKSKNENLKNTQNLNKLYQNGSQLSGGNNRRIDESPESQLQVETKRLSNNVSPVYLDVFDSPGKASKFIRGKLDQPSHYKIMELKTSGNRHERGNDASSHACSEVRGTTLENKLETNNNSSKEMKDPYSNLSGEEFRKLRKHEDEKELLVNSNFRENLYSIVESKNSPRTSVNQLGKNNSVNSSSVDLNNLTQSQKTIINMLAKNSDVLASLQRQDSLSPRSKSHENIQTSIDHLNSKPSKSESSQTSVKLPNNAAASSTNQNCYSNEYTDRKFINTGKRDFKTDCLADIFPMVLTKSDEIKVEFKEGNSKVNSFEVSDRMKDTPYSNTKNLPKGTNSYNDSPFSRNESINLYESQFPLPVIPETVPELIYENLDSENSSSDNNRSIGNGTGNNIEMMVSKTKTPLFSNPTGSSSKSLDGTSEFLKDKTNIFPQLKMSPKVLHQILDDSVLTNRTSTDNEERSYSNDLESSYETLYDPVLTSRYQASDDNMFYM